MKLLYLIFIILTNVGCAHIFALGMYAVISGAGSKAPQMSSPSDCKAEMQPNGKYVRVCKK